MEYGQELVVPSGKKNKMASEVKILVAEMLSCNEGEEITITYRGDANAKKD